MIVQRIKFRTFFVSNRFLKISSTSINIRIIGIKQRIRFASTISIILLYNSIFCFSYVARQIGYNGLVYGLLRDSATKLTNKN